VSAGGQIAARVVGFVRLLRAAGMPAAPGRMLDAARAAPRWACRAARTSSGRSTPYW